MLWTKILGTAVSLPLASGVPLYYVEHFTRQALSKSVNILNEFFYIGRGLEFVAINAPGVASGFTFKGFPSHIQGPYDDDHDRASEFSKQYHGAVPQGVNPLNCSVKPGQYPIILIPGTGELAYDNWAYMGPKLALEEGYCVYSFNHNPFDFWGIRDERLGFFGYIADSASALGVVIEEVLNRTGAEKVDLVGHSQGAGALPYYYLKNLVQGKPKVRKLVSIAPSLGTRGEGIENCIRKLAKSKFFAWIVYQIEKIFNGNGLTEQLYDSPFMVALHAGGLTIPGVEYHNIATKTDTVLLPWSRCIVKEENRTITNAILQDYCPNDYSNHHYVSYSPNVYQMVINYIRGTPFHNITCMEPPEGARVRPDTYDETGAFTSDDY